MIQVRPEYNRVIVGILIGIGIMLFGFGIVSVVFSLLESTGIMEEAIGSGYDKRMRTMLLIGICTSIIGIQYFAKRKTENIQRGIALSAILAGACWIYRYYNDLFFAED